MTTNNLSSKMLSGLHQQPVFNRFGRSFHLRIGGAADLRQILELDEAHWVATSAPVLTINADEAFLALLDSDGDGRVRVAELREAVAWLLEHIKEPDSIRADNTALRLDSIDLTAPNGPAIQRAADKVRARIGDRAQPSITLEDVRRIQNSEEAGSLGSSGLVHPRAAADPAQRAFLEDVLATVGGEPHTDGKLAVSESGLAQFFAEAHAYLDWHGKGEVDPAGTLMPFAESTPAVFALVQRLEEPLDHYFALCHLAAVAPFVQGLPTAAPSRPGDYAIASSESIQDFLARAPLAAPMAEGVLDLTGPLNPLYADDLQALRTSCLEPLFGGDTATLDTTGWKKLKDTLEPHENWTRERPETRVGELDLERLRSYVEEPHYRQAAESLFSDSRAQAIVMDNLRLVEKLILYQAYLLPMANSFVSFPDLYDPAGRALFEMGTLIMDGRHFTLSVRVPDRQRHARLSAQSNIFMLYVQVSGGADSKPYEVAVPVTAGGKGRLQVGTWGIFQDVDGSERHAKVVDIVENPISLSEAIVAPFRRLGRAVAKKLQEITSAAEQKLSKVGTSTVTQVTDVSAASAPTSAGTGGMLAGGGIAIAALGSSAAFITKTLSTLSWQGTLGGLTLAALAVILPTAVFAWLRLRARDLSSLLEGSGWAVNARMWLTVSQARSFTYEPLYGSAITTAKWILQRLSWIVVLILLGLLAWSVDHFGLMDYLKTFTDRGS